MAFADADPKDDPKVVPADPRDTELDPKDDESEAETEEETGDVESAEETEEEGSEEKADDEEESEEKAEPKVDISKIPLEELLKSREDLRRHVQSVSDRAADKERRRLDELRASERNEARKKREEEELDELFEAEDYEAVGKRAKEQRDTAKRDAAESQRWIGEFARSGEGYYREVYKDLGEETLDRVLEEMAGKPIFDVGSRLAEERLTRGMGSQIAERVKSELEAALAEAGVTKRSEKVEKKQAASEEVSGSKKSKTVRTERTDSDWIDAYNDGEVAFEELPDDAKKKLRK